LQKQALRKVPSSVNPDDARIRRPIASLGRLTEHGTPVLAPEVQLFYKSKGKLPKDEIDFAALPLLDSEARQWLDEVSARTAPSQPWRSALSP
jgi:hypothetical protein